MSDFTDFHNPLPEETSPTRRARQTTTDDIVVFEEARKTTAWVQSSVVWPLEQ